MSALFEDALGRVGRECLERFSVSNRPGPQTI
jgi:hypothetical protein